MNFTFNDQTCTSCGLVVPDPDEKYLLPLLKSYGRQKVVEELQEALGVKPVAMEYQYRNGGMRGLNDNFDLMIHYQLDL